MRVSEIVASLIIIMGCGYIGIIFASSLEIRVRQLEQLHLALEQMSFSICFLKLPVADAVYGAARSRAGAVGRILSSAARDICENGVCPSAAVEKSVRENRRYLCIGDDDIEILSEFASRLGTGDTENEISNINAACARLKLARMTAEGERDRKSKMWRGIGFLLGIFAVVMLF